MKWAVEIKCGRCCVMIRFIVQWEPRVKAVDQWLILRSQA